MHHLRMVIGLSLGLALLSACRKEAPERSTTAAPAVQHGHSKAPHPPYYALYAVSRHATGLALFDPDNRRMAPLGRIVDAETRENVDHFTGITWDPVYGCTWLVTNKWVSNERFQGMLWRIPGELPTSWVEEIRAERVAPLTVRQGPEGPVMDAYDIEFFEGEKIAMLRRDEEGHATLSYMNQGGGVVDGFPIDLPFATALTVDCDHLIKVLSLKKGDFTHPLITYNYDTGDVIEHQEIGCAEFAYPEAGISPKAECGDARTIYAVNAGRNRALMVTSEDPDLHSDQTEVLPTIDMTIVPR